MNYLSQLVQIFNIGPWFCMHRIKTSGLRMTVDCKYIPEHNTLSIFNRGSSKKCVKITNQIKSNNFGHGKKEKNKST